LKTRRAKTSVELRDGQSFALAGLLDNSETKTLSRVPVLGDLPVLGNLFRSKSFQKNESELMFIVTAQLVKPLNRDDVPQLRGVDGLKNGSPLGVEPKGEGIDGLTGHKVSTQNTESTPTTTTSPEAPKTADPKTKTTEKETSSVSTSSSARMVNPILPAPRTLRQIFPQ